MKKVIMTKGLPASGKTTWAKELLAKEPGQWKRINKDDLRAMLDNGKWSKQNEKFVLDMRDLMLQTALITGYNVVIDDTNLAQKHEEKIKQLIDFHNTVSPKKVRFEIKDFTDVPLEECIRRDQTRANYVGEKVIRKMYNDYLAPKFPEVTFDPTLPTTILCDMDGTLALFPNKNPYERDFINDIVNKPVKKVIDFWNNDGSDDTRLIIVSGRKHKFQKESEKWLKKNNIYYDEIYMPRADDDNRKDVVIKQEIYEQYIKGKYNVLFVLDDRNQVVDFWRSQGLTCFQVATGDF